MEREYVCACMHVLVCTSIFCSRENARQSFAAKTHQDKHIKERDAHAGHAIVD
jgi:hypothetical protein